MEKTTQRRVAIVGAGASGLAACKHALERGLRPTVFEFSSGAVGGVWARALASTRLQTPRTLYEFSDFPWPPDVADVFPDHAQAAEYLRSYAARFGVLERVRFDCRVTAMEYAGVGEEEAAAWDRWAGDGSAFGDGRGEWRLTVQRQGEGGDVVEMGEAVGDAGGDWIWCVLFVSELQAWCHPTDASRAVSYGSVAAHCGGPWQASSTRFRCLLAEGQPVIPPL